MKEVHLDTPNGSFLIGDIPESPLDKNEAYLHVIVVLPEERRIGVGTRLLKKFESLVIGTRGMSVNTLITTEDENARLALVAFFEKNGYQFDSDMGLGQMYSKSIEH